MTTVPQAAIAAATEYLALTHDVYPQPDGIVRLVTGCTPASAHADIDVAGLLAAAMLNLQSAESERLRVEGVQAVADTGASWEATCLEIREQRDRAAARLTELEAALSVAEETLALSERIPIRDPQHHAAIDRLGQEIGYGALMAGVQRAWREHLAETGFPMGGEFVAGPCYATVTATLTTIRAALAATPHAPAPVSPCLPIETAPRNQRVLVWWPIVQLDDNNNLTDKQIDGAWLVSELQGGVWVEPDCLNAIGTTFDDDYEYSEFPKYWMPLPSPPAGQEG